VREKEIGAMEQPMVTPIRPFELILGKLLLIAALLIFGIPIHGDFLLLFGCTALFQLSTL
jgi:ABC-2 type transport system permease protein